MNQFSNVQFIHAAVGAPVGTTDFILCENTNSHIPGTYVGATPKEYESHGPRNGTEIQVRCLSLDQAWKDDKLPVPDLIKIDIDGAEKHALPHMYELAKHVRPLILLELHNPECDEAAWEFASRTGYLLQSIDRRRTLRTREEVHGTIICLPPGSSPIYAD